jgi:hypothetical protein
MIRWLIPLAAAAWLAAPATAEPPKAAAKTYHVPYRLTDTKHILVRAKLNGQGPYNFILDTGAPAVFIPKKLAKSLKLTLDEKGWGQFDQFQVEGGLSVDGVKTRVENLFQLEGMNGMGLAGVELHGVIGYNVLARFRITYDFTADKLTWVPLDFQPPAVHRVGGGGQGGLEILGPVMKLLAGLMGVIPNFETRPRGFLGVETENRKDGVYVKSVVPGGPAAKAGLKAGDKLRAVGVSPHGRQRANMTDIDVPRDLDRALAEARAGEDAKIEVRRGEQTETIIVPLGRGL